MLKVKSLMRAHLIASKFRADFSLREDLAGRKVDFKNLMVKEEGDTGTLYLYDQIGGDSFNEGITAKAVVEALDALEAKGCKAVNVRIASEGGDVFEAKAIVAALRRSKMAVTTYNDSIAASAASFILTAGSRVVSTSHATLMCHRAWSLAIGNAEDLVAMSEILTLEDRNIASMYAEKTGKTPDECLALMAAESWFNAQQAKDLGFVDEIADDDGGQGDDDEGGSSASAKAVLSVATKTQERIRLHTAVVLQDQKNRIARASPGRTTPQRPAARK